MKEIDLSKSQIIDGDVKVKVWNDSEDKPIYIRYLQCIDHSLVRPFICFDGGGTRENTGMFCSWEYAELIEPKYRVKCFYDLVEALKKEGYKKDPDDGFFYHPKDDKIMFTTSMLWYEGKGVEKDRSGFFTIDGYSFDKIFVEEVKGE